MARAIGRRRSGRIFIIILIMTAGSFLLVSYRSPVWWGITGGDDTETRVESSTRDHLELSSETWSVDGLILSATTKGVERKNNLLPEAMRRNLELLGVTTLPEFLPDYKNPCWREPLHVDNPYPQFRGSFVSSVLNRTTQNLVKLFRERLKNGTGWRLRCMPYFYVAGLEKCGTTDLTEKVAMHPDVVSGSTRTPHWWTRARARAGMLIGNHTQPEERLQHYVDLFDIAAEKIRLRVKGGYHHMVTGEGSATTVEENFRWERLAGNGGLTEPKYINPHFIHAVTPHAKIILSLRNPTDRLYSGYLFYVITRNKSAAHFHTVAEGAVAAMEQCLASFSLRKCVYNPTSTRASMEYMVRLYAGMYYVYIKDWLEVFPRQQMHFVYFEDYADDRIPVLNEIFSFLEVDPLPEVLTQHIREMNVTNAQRPYSFHVGPMLPKTRLLLDSFYAKYNAMLAELLGDDRFLWKGQ